MGRLTAEQKKFYEDNGYIVLKNVLPRDVLDKISDEYDKLFARKNPKKMEGAWVGSDENDREHEGETLVKSIHNLQFHHAIFSKYLFDDNLLDALEDIMKTSNIAIHHTKAHMKPAQKSGEFVMHQDYHYFPHKNDSMVAAFLHLDAAYPENGGLFVYPGSHKLGPLEDVGARESNYHYLDQKKWPLSGATPLIAERGDVVVFSYLLVHGSPPNTTDKPRRMLLLQCADAHDEPLEVDHQPLKPGQGWLLRGQNLNRDASIAKRNQYN